MRAPYLLGFGIAVLACGGGGGNGTGSGSDPLPSIATTKDNVCDQVASVACYDWYGCCSEGEIERFLAVSDPRTEAECRDDVKRMCDRKLTTETYSLLNARVTFDSTVMDACLKALLVPDNMCTTVQAMLPWTAACMKSAWVGTVATGGPCDYSYECTSPDSNYCAPSRACTARPTSGQPCDTGCATGLYCNLGMCAQQLGVGGPCTSSSQCMKDLFCDQSASTPVCAALKNPGETCTGDASCKLGGCLPGSCSGTGQSCYTASNCGGHCSNNSALFCSTAGDCGIGHCSIATTVNCYFPTACTSTQGTCVFPNACNPGVCAGNVVCADVNLPVDYCTDALSQLPLPH